MRGKRFCAAVAVVAVGLALAVAPGGQAKAATGTGGMKITGVYAGRYYGFQNPTGIADCGGNIWVTNSTGNTVTELKAGTGAWVRTLSKPAYEFSTPIGIACDGRDIWVANFDTGTVTEVNACDGRLVRVLHGLGEGYDVVTEGTKVWVTDFQGKVFELNADNGSRIKTLAGPGFANPEALATDGRDVWVLNNICDFCSVTEIDASDGSVVRAISGSRYDFGIPRAVASDGTDVWVTNPFGSNVTEVNAANGSLVRVLSGARYQFNDPDSVVSDGTHVWVLDGLANTVTELDAATGALVGRISLSVAANPYGNPESIIRVGRHLWVTDNWEESSDTAGSVIELTTTS